MQCHAHHSDDSDVANHGLIVPYQVFSAFTAGLVVVQAFLAGQASFKNDDDYFDYHEIVGGLFLLALIVQIVMTWLLTKPGSYYRKHLLIQNGLILALSVLLMWLGYEASDSPNAGVWHLPLAVFICAYAGGVFSHAWGFRRHFGI